MLAVRNERDMVLVMHAVHIATDVRARRANAVLTCHPPEQDCAAGQRASAEQEPSAVDAPGVETDMGVEGSPEPRLEKPQSPADPPDPASEREATQEAWRGPKSAWASLTWEQQLQELPERMRPRAPVRGNFSYSLKDPGSLAIVKVLLRERAVFARRGRDGQAPEGPRSFGWRVYGSPAAAFDEAVRAKGFGGQLERLA